MVSTRGAESWWGCSHSDSGSESGLLIDSDSGSDFDSNSGSHAKYKVNQQGAFRALNEREPIAVLTCVYSYTCARKGIPHPV